MSTDDDPLSGGGLFGDRLFTALDKREPVAGAVLVAAPDMPDPNFQKAIVYLIEHDPGGSLGVVLTRRSDTAVHTMLPAWEPLCARPAALYIGGPVNPDRGIALCVLKSGVDGEEYSCIQQVDGRVHLVDLDGEPELLAEAVEGMRIFVGYTGWAPGQLESELDRGDWYVAPGLPGDVIAPARTDVWARVLARQEMPLPLYSTFLADGSVN